MNKSALYLLLLLQGALFAVSPDFMDSIEVPGINLQSYDATRNKVMLKVGSGSTIILRESKSKDFDPITLVPSKKTRFRPSIGLIYRSIHPENTIMNAIDVSVSYSYNNVERTKRNYATGEIFYPKLQALHFFSIKNDSSYYLGTGLGAFTSWQKETHTKTPDLLSSNDDVIYNIRSFYYTGIAASAVFGREMFRLSEVSSSIQLEMNSPIIPLSANNTGKRPPFSIELSYIAGF